MKKAVILLNMGGPNNLDEVEVFLKNMFNDPNIITVKNNLLRSIIAWMITTSRKKIARENYSKIGGKSPICGYTKQLVQKVQVALGDDYYVTFAMCYTPPFSQDAIAELENKDIQEVILFPLYPQYSTTTTKSSLEDFAKKADELFFDTKVTTIEPFFDNALYNKSLVSNIKEALKDKKADDFELIFSAHSLPQKIIDSGDPYQNQIELHVKIIKEFLEEEDINFANTHIAYQSKLGPVKWLEPSLEDKIKSLSSKNIIICPLSFTIDNSETEFELSIEYAEVAKDFGIKNYIVSKCPNDSEDFVKFITQAVKNAV
ncbi:MAG: ferrochelatase [Sulfurospirillaceae bacterium]|nr:ferrochelatase [Sulfurospirillaceae bacterium]